jgi:isopentenyldiphosphate isomerase
LSIIQAGLGIRSTALNPAPTPHTCTKNRAAHIWLVDNQGGLLLQRRSEFKDTFPDRWDVSVGGHVDAG